MMHRLLLVAVSYTCIAGGVSAEIANAAEPGMLADQLLAGDLSKLAAEAREHGDASRGALLFHQQHLMCVKCHRGEEDARLGPDLTKQPKDGRQSDLHLIEAILKPSVKVRKGFETVSVQTDTGAAITGLVAAEDARSLTIRDISSGKSKIISKDSIEQRRVGEASLMPAGLANLIGGKQQFLDLARYLMEITEHGSARAAQLDPPPGLFAAQALPEYENDIDHAGMIADLDDAAYKRGQQIYQRLCVNCHGTKDKRGSLPTSLKFAEGKFKNGSDPHSMYRTLTHGYGMMMPQAWMAPKQKYDVIHYIRNAYVRPHNESQWVETTESYLAGLPKGEQRGPEPSKFDAWANMDYGPSLIHTYEFGKDAHNFAYKGIAMRVDPGSGGVSRGKRWTVFDHDTLRLAGGWSQNDLDKGFIDYNGIMFNGRHNIHPRVEGKVEFETLKGPGWAHPESKSFEDPRLVGRDGRRYGPLPRDWAQYKGLYHYGDKTIISYTVGETEVLEMSGLLNASKTYARHLTVGPRKREMVLQVAALPGGEAKELAGLVGFANKDSDRSLVGGVTGFPGDYEYRWRHDSDGRLLLTIPKGDERLELVVWLTNLSEDLGEHVLSRTKPSNPRPINLETLTQGGPSRWASALETEKIIGPDDGPFAIDVLRRPDNNPWNARVRPTGFDFYPDGDTAAISCWDGDVWRVTGLSDKSKTLTWRRIATGLFQPLGVKVIDNKIHLTCRDQLVILHDNNGDGETDFYESFNNDHQVTDHFHEFAMGLQTDKDGNFYYAKSARHALKALVPHHGTLLRISKDGQRTDILANGFRAANGVCINPDGSFIVTDQEGHWNPKNRINWVREGGFYGNMFGYHDVTDERDSAMQQPLCWITNSFDRSPAELLWVDSKAWGPLKGSLLNLSYGFGKVYVVPHEKVGEQMQGGMCALPIPNFPTGVMRGRFHPGDGQLYLCGMFAWAGSANQPGGFYRLRYTGKAVHLPTSLSATSAGMQVGFSGKLEPKVAEDASRYQVKTWSLKRTKSYGSKHYDEKTLKVRSAKLSSDGKTVSLEIEGMKPTWCMEIKYSLSGDAGEPVSGVIHNTVHSVQ